MRDGDIRTVEFKSLRAWSSTLLSLKHYIWSLLEHPLQWRAHRLTRQLFHLGSNLRMAGFPHPWPLYLWDDQFHSDSRIINLLKRETLEAREKRQT